MKTNIASEDFRVQPGKNVKLKEWPTTVKPFCRSKKRYRKLLEEQVEELSALQRLHYASNRYALFPGGNDYPAKETGVVSIQVRDPEESKRVIEAITACLNGV